MKNEIFKFADVATISNVRTINFPPHKQAIEEKILSVSHSNQMISQMEAVLLQSFDLTSGFQSW